jgi:hypothetical protein
LTETPPPRTELVSGIAWIALGAAIFWGSWTMDRLESLQINPYTAPGLVPGVLGVLIAVCGAAMTVRSLFGGALRAQSDLRSEPIVNRRVLLSLVLCLAFALGLLGHGLPFWAAAAIFLFAHIFLFRMIERRGTGSAARQAIGALAIGIGAALAIFVVFQELLLVRLP